MKKSSETAQSPVSVTFWLLRLLAGNCLYAVAAAFNPFLLGALSSGLELHFNTVGKKGVQLVSRRQDVFLRADPLPTSRTHHLLLTVCSQEHLPALRQQTPAWHQATLALAMMSFENHFTAAEMPVFPAAQSCSLTPEKRVS